MSKRVLIGDANYAEFEVLNDLLTAKGFAVTWLRNGRDVVRQFDEIKPDLMVLDALLPGMTGLKVTQKIKAQPTGEDVKVILMSSVYKQFKSQYESRAKVGVDAYTQKPVNVSELERLVYEVLELPSPDAAGAEDATIIDEPAETAAAGAAPSPGRTTVEADGDLSETPFPRLLYYLYKFHRTGALRVELDQISKVIYFRQGRPVFVTSNQSTESLGRYLVSRNFISVEQYNMSLERLLASGGNHGDVLLEMEAISPHDLFKGLREHVKEKVLSIFSWDRGTYRFRPGKFDLAENVAITIEPMDLIHEGVRRFYHLARLESFFNEFKNRRLKRRPEATEAKDKLGLGPQELKFITLINDRRTIGQVVARSNLNLTQTFQTLYMLLIVDYLRFRGDVDMGRARERAAERAGRGKTAPPRATDDPLRLYNRRIAKAVRVMGEMDFYERLKLDRSARLEQIKDAYFRASHRYHDHQFYNQAGAKVQEAADRIFQWVTEAYSTLINDQARREYDAQLLAPAHRAAEEPTEVQGAFEPDMAAADEAFASEPEAASAPRADWAPPEEEEPRAAAEADSGGFFSFDEGDLAAEAESAAGMFDDLGIDTSPPAGSNGDATHTASAEEVSAFMDEINATDGDSASLGGGDSEESSLDDLESLWDAGAGLASSNDEDSDFELPFDSIDTHEGTEVATGMANVVRAELAFQDGEDALRDKDFADAAEAFARALAMAPNEAEYHAYLGWARYRAEPENADSVRGARELIEKAVKINPSLDTGYYFLGVMAHMLGDKEQARVHLRKAVQLNPDNPRADRALAELEKG
ncbi:MAG: response regulator [Deltaproteobacteria bacterium]|nr:response regulator [bacterium]MCB9477748.1 response regulator [Deltaproteobacteria bacterium]MCB9487577.1 response regulator [Deltaproteobacteria bacterium]